VPDNIFRGIRTSTPPVRIDQFISGYGTSAFQYHSRTEAVITKSIASLPICSVSSASGYVSSGCSSRCQRMSTKLRWTRAGGPLQLWEPVCTTAIQRQTRIWHSGDW
jgi:hypothetical protein